jgi:dTDP-L-rhamnose 4-epimerase
MSERILITGGAGFVGAHLAHELLAHGQHVRVLDSLIEQVHPEGRPPTYLDDDVELRVGDVRDPAAVSAALEDIDVVIHLAARVGVGQSMYEPAEYTSVNSHGTGVLLRALIDHPVRKLLVASSMSIYGEGLYRHPDGIERAAGQRTRAQLQQGRWELEHDGRRLQPVPTPEDKSPDLASHYALGKYEQERMCLLHGSAFGLPTVALRFFNVYGPHQALSNPYTGVLAIFANRLLHGRPPMIFEDGAQRRDFVNVTDVARCCRLAVERTGADGRAVNVGSGRDVTVAEIAAKLGEVLDRPDCPATVTGEYRVGDIRHCFADITLARHLLGYEPSVSLDDGISELAGWLAASDPAADRVDHATAQLVAHGLTL